MLPLKNRRTTFVSARRLDNIVLTEAGHILDISGLLKYFSSFGVFALLLKTYYLKSTQWNKKILQSGAGNSKLKTIALNEICLNISKGFISIISP